MYKDPRSLAEPAGVHSCFNLPTTGNPIWKQRISIYFISAPWLVSLFIIIDKQKVSHYLQTALRPKAETMHLIHF